MGEQLTCSTCRRIRDVAPILDEDGREVTVAEYTATLQSVDAEVLCDECLAVEARKPL